MSQKVKHLSVSKIEAMLLCPRYFKYQYVDKLPQTASGFMLAGRVVHGLIEKALKRVIAGTGLPSAQDLDDLYIPEWEAQVQEEEEKDNFIGWQWDEADSSEKVKKECRALVRMTREEILPTVRPRFVEHEIKMPYQSDVGPFIVWGYIDLIEEDGSFLDWKTSDKVSARQKKMGYQMMGYSRAVHELTGEEIVPAKKIFLVRGPRPRWEVEKYEITPKHRALFEEVAIETWKMCQAEAFPPVIETWKHSEKFCSFWDICPSGGELLREEF